MTILSKIIASRGSRIIERIGLFARSERILYRPKCHCSFSNTTYIRIDQNHPQKKYHLNTSHYLISSETYETHDRQTFYQLNLIKILGLLGFLLFTMEDAYCDNETNINPKGECISKKELRKLSLNEAIKRSKELLERRLEEVGAPGLAIQVSVDGKNVWGTGIGYADVENRISCSTETVMRIASISKSLTMTSVGQLLEAGKLDLDVPIQTYLPNFPVKTYNGEEVVITLRHLLSHQSGIRHYALKDPSSEEEKADESNPKISKDEKSDKTSPNNTKIQTLSGEDTKGDTEGTKLDQKNMFLKEKRQKLRRLLNRARRTTEEDKEEQNEFDLEEYYIKEHFKTIEESMKIFEDDPLFFKPGDGFLYTTHGWTVVSGIVEAASGKKFDKVMIKLFHDLGMYNTYLDKHSPIIYNRARFYKRNKNGVLKNAPYVDDSYKWAGGGFLSTVNDLSKFGNAMLYSYQHKDASDTKVGFLKSSTMETMWNPISSTKMGWDVDGHYGFGWGIVEDKEKSPFCHSPRHYISHTGGAIGASSVLLIMPTHNENTILPKGVVVAIICNMQNVGLNKIALEIAKNFENLV